MKNFENYSSFSESRATLRVVAPPKSAFPSAYLEIDGFCLLSLAWESQDWFGIILLVPQVWLAGFSFS